MGRKRQAFAKYRPRVWTLIVLLLVTALLVLSNLSHDQGEYAGLSESFAAKSYGWPLIWHRYVVFSRGMYDFHTVGWYFSVSRVAADALLWLTILAISGIACEWLTRRYQPRLRWSLRTMLVAVALVGAFCAWFVAALERAKVQDQLIAATPNRTIYVERWGPKWLDLFGADRFRRHIVDADLHVISNAEEGEELFRQLARLPKLRCLSFEVDHFTPEMITSLNEMRHLRRLQIGHHSPYEQTYEQTRNWRGVVPRLQGLAELQELHIRGFAIESASLEGLTRLKSIGFESPDNVDERRTHECLTAIGKATQIEHLFLSYFTIKPESLACLTGLTNLKTLCLNHVKIAEMPRLRHLPPLPRLEGLDLAGTRFSDEDLPELAKLPNLKSLALRETSVTAKGLTELASLKSLEELALDGDGDRLDPSYVPAAVLPLKGLQKLHLNRHSYSGADYWRDITLDEGHSLLVHEDDVDEFRKAVQALRKSRPGIVIDDDPYLILFSSWDPTLFEYSEDSKPVRLSSWLPESDSPWMNGTERATFEAEGGWARFDAAAHQDDDARTVTGSF
jgi:hypothetical protein